MAIGPGVVGTTTPFGHGGIAQGEALNAAAVLGGFPIACLRISFADKRERHRVVSHHSLTALTRVTLARVVVAVPSLPDDYARQLESALDGAGVWVRHDRGDSSAGSVPPPDMRGVLVTVELTVIAMIIGIVGGVLLAVLISLAVFKKGRLRRPFLCGENVGEGKESYTFASLMDEPVMANVTSYYLITIFGEDCLTKWANLVALLILITLFARVAML